MSFFVEEPYLIARLKEVLAEEVGGTPPLKIISAKNFAGVAFDFAALVPFVAVKPSDIIPTSSAASHKAHLVEQVWHVVYVARPKPDAVNYASSYAEDGVVVGKIVEGLAGWTVPLPGYRPTRWLATDEITIDMENEFPLRFAIPRGFTNAQ